VALYELKLVTYRRKAKVATSHSPAATADALNSVFLQSDWSLSGST
jgi:hypothetical protein